MGVFFGAQVNVNNNSNPPANVSTTQPATNQAVISQSNSAPNQNQTSAQNVMNPDNLTDGVFKPEHNPYRRVVPSGRCS